MKNLILLALALACSPAQAITSRWPVKAAKQWFAAQPLPLGSDFIPSTAENQLEMWQEATFDPVTIQRELALAEATGFNTVRVFLHDLPWSQDRAGFVKRVDLFLSIAAAHHIKPLLVLFDSCWDGHPVAGPQPPPLRGIHNSRWVQSPGVDALLDPSQLPRLKAYVRGIIATFARDPRILGWDLWNEPDNNLTDAPTDPVIPAVVKLLPQVFRWARSANPIQPLTSGIWNGDWSTWATLRPAERIQLTHSDFITFHNYDPAPKFELQVTQLERFGRPLVCTEYMARPLGSTFQAILPVAKRHNVGAMNWGFVAGKTQTYYPWDSWQNPYDGEPPLWFHDVYRSDGTPYREEEVAFLKSYSRSL